MEFVAIQTTRELALQMFAS